eukprot:Em0029g19a
MENPFQHITCGVCFKPYNDPRILPCLHSFCLQCLHHEIEKCGSQQMFQCPICEQNTSIPVGGASVLPQNLHLGFEVEVAGYLSKMTSNSDVACDHCAEGSSDPAVVFCCACHHFLCAFCLEHHKRNRIWSKHNMVGLDQEGARQLHTTMKPRDHYCSQPSHEENKLNFYCETCSLLVCLHCTRSFRKCHTVKEISTLAKTHKMEMAGALEEAKVVVTKLTGAINENNRMIEQVEISKRNAFLAINQAFETLQQTLEERKKTLLSELEAISLSKTTALTLQKEQFEKMVGDIGHYTDMASQILQTHTDHEIVALGGLIPTELQATLKRVQTISLTPNQHSNVTVSVQTDELIKQLLKLGNIIDFYPSPSSCAWISTSVAKVGTRYAVKIQSKTSEGAEYPHGGVEVKGEMRSKTHNGAVVYGEVEDHRDGTYTITLTPQAAGPHQLLITMDGQHVQNSPNDLDVRPKRDYHTLCKAQQVIQCNGPRCVAIHDNGDIYVGSDDHCIYVFDQTGELKNTIGSYGTGDGQFSYPNGISIKGDVLYVADTENHRVQKLTSSGKFLHKFGQQGSDQGQFKMPLAVIIDSNNKLIVSDYNNHRIQSFNENGGWLLTIDGKCSGNHSFKSPWGLALDPQGNIHVADHDYTSVYQRRCLCQDGWGGVMVECEDDTLASYSEDEKEMEKAERAVEWKMAKKSKLHDVMCVSYTVPATVLRSRAESTTKKYLGAYQRWRTWANARQGVPSFPVQGASSGAVRAVTLLLSNQIVAFLNKNASSIEYIHLSDLYTGAARDSNGRVPCVSNEIRDSQTCHNHQFEQSASQNGLRWTLDSAINLQRRQDLFTLLLSLVCPSPDTVMFTFQPAADDMDNIVLALGQKKTILKQSKDYEDLKNYSTIVRTKDLDSSLMVVSDSSEAVTLLLSNQIVAFLNKNASSVEYIHLSDLYTGAAHDR